MTVDDTTIWRINTDSEQDYCRGRAARDSKLAAADAIVRYPGSLTSGTGTVSKRCSVIEMGSQLHRFRNSDDPNGKNVRSSPGPVRESSMRLAQAYSCR
jgi:hypothetical protein